MEWSPRRWLLVTVVLAVGAVAVVGFLVTAEPCLEPAPSALSLSQMADVKRRVDAHVREPGVELVLDGPSATFLLSDFLEYPLSLTVADGVVAAEVAAPALGTCLAIQYEGGVRVDDDGVFVQPDRLRVGRLDVSAVARLRTWRVPPEWSWRPAASRLLHAIRSLRVEGDELLVRIDDPWGLR